MTRIQQESCWIFFYLIILDRSSIVRILRGILLFIFLSLFFLEKMEMVRPYRNFESLSILFICTSILFIKAIFLADRRGLRRG